MARKKNLPPIPIEPNRSKEPCPLCDRPLGTLHVDRHHLIPASQGGKEQSPIHRVCHTKIHSLFTEKELGRDWFSFELLRAHPQIAKFILWISKKPAHFIDRNKRSARKGPR